MRVIYSCLLICLMFCICFGEFSYYSDGKVFAEHQKDCRLWIYDYDGIPSYNYSYAGFQHNPSQIAGEVLYYYKRYVDGYADGLEKLINNANWLVTNAVSHGNYSILNYEFPFPQYGMEPPWRSSIAQGKAVEALIKAHEITNNQTYLDTAKSLVNSFFVQVKDGGVTLKTPNEGWWYEQHSRNDVSDPSRVLNGMISSVLSIYDYYKYTNDTAGKFLFDQGVLSLKNNLPLYDDNGWSYYDIHNKPVNLNYHQAHIGLLDALYNITEEKSFREYKNKWQDFTEVSDITPPAILSINATDRLSTSNPSSITVKFDEALNESSVNPLTFIVRKSGNTVCTEDDTVAGEVTLDSVGNTARFKPLGDLRPDTQYTVIITIGVKDLAGNPLPTDRSWSFITAAN